jgi:hypothetical protein
MELITNSFNKPLPEPYQALAQKRLKQHAFKPEDPNYYLIDSFDWQSTPEGHHWWREVDEGGSPPIPESSLKELNDKPEPRKHSTMEDVFAGMNRHAKKENSKEEITEEDRKLLKELNTVSSEQPERSSTSGGYPVHPPEAYDTRITGEGDSAGQGSPS